MYSIALSLCICRSVKCAFSFGIIVMEFGQSSVIHQWRLKAYHFTAKCSHLCLTCIFAGASELRCYDWKGDPVSEGKEFVPHQNDPCHTCTCDGGFPVMCTSVLCSAPECSGSKKAVAVSIMVPTGTGKPGKTGRHFPVRENQGIC